MLNQKIKVITLQEIKTFVDSKAAVLIIDARTKKWDDGRRIPGAISLPADTAPEHFSRFLSKKDQALVIYCGGIQCPAANILAKNLISAGYSDVMGYPGGMKEWHDEHNLPVQGEALSFKEDCESSCHI